MAEQNTPPSYNRPTSAREAKGQLRGGQRDPGLFLGGPSSDRRALPSLISTQKIESGATEAQAKKKSAYGIVFWLLLGVCVFIDASDVITTLIEAVIGATVIGAPIAVVIVGIVDMLKIGVDAILAVYLWSLGRGAGRRLVVELIGAIMELIPFIDLLPLCTISFVLAVWLGGLGSKAGSGAVNTIISKARSFTGPAGAVAT